MGRDYKRTKGDAGRDGGRFVAIPWAVLDSPAYARLSHPAKAMLMEVARQFVRDNNGRLLAGMAYLAPRGWKSNDVITRAVRDLVEAGFIHQTVQGQRPNKASWYALTWRALDRHPGYDPGAAESFQRGAYRNSTPPLVRQASYKPAQKSYVLTPSPGVESAPIAPSPGVESAPPTPSPGAIGATFAHLSTPSPGDHLDIPSAGREATGIPAVQGIDDDGPAADQSRSEITPEPAIETLDELWRKVGIRAMALPRIGRLQAPAPLADSTQVPTGSTGSTGKPLSIKSRIITALLSGPKTSTELDAMLGTSAAPHVRKRMVLDGKPYSVTSERIPPVAGRSGFSARYSAAPVEA